ncbi:hypothetical protein ABFX02_10G148400 [Erythranthe guttata]
MLKRQESSLSSSRRQAAAAAATPPPETHHAKAIGCMSGLIQLFSKYQNPNKRLTFGRKQEKRKPTSPTKTKESLPAKNPPSSPKQDRTKKQNSDVKVPRSPTLPPEIRRSDAAKSPQNPRTPSSSLVARLMGLEDIGGCAAVKRAALEEDRTAAEKRQRLLEALEKCNEDLEALKRIIKAVQTSDVRLQPPPPHRGVLHSSGGDNEGSITLVKPYIEKCTDAGGEKQNIPVEEECQLTRSPLSGFSGAGAGAVQNTNTAGATKIHATTQQRKPTSAKKPGEDDEPTAAKLLNTDSTLQMRRRAVSAAIAPSWCSRAMVHSVEEVCVDIAWGEKREVGRIGLVLQDHLCRELIEDLIKEMNSNWPIRPLPLEACKRKLCF